MGPLEPLHTFLPPTPTIEVLKEKHPEGSYSYQYSINSNTVFCKVDSTHIEIWEDNPYSKIVHQINLLINRLPPSPNLSISTSSVEYKCSITVSANSDEIKKVIKLLEDNKYLPINNNKDSELAPEKQDRFYEKLTSYQKQLEEAASNDEASRYVSTLNELFVLMNSAHLPEIQMVKCYLSKIEEFADSPSPPKSIVELLISKVTPIGPQADFRALAKAAKNRHIEFVRQLLEAKVDVDQTDYAGVGRTALYWALENKDEAMIALLQRYNGSRQWL